MGDDLQAIHLNGEKTLSSQRIKWLVQANEIKQPNYNINNLSDTYK